MHIAESFLYSQHPCCFERLALLPSQYLQNIHLFSILLFIIFLTPLVNIYSYLFVKITIYNYFVLLYHKILQPVNTKITKYDKIF